MFVCLWLTEVLDTFLRPRSVTGFWCQWQWEVPSLALTMEAKAYWNQPENNQVSSLLKEFRPFVSTLHLFHLSCLGTTLTNFSQSVLKNVSIRYWLLTENSEKLCKWDTMEKTKKKRTALLTESFPFLKYLIQACSPILSIIIRHTTVTFLVFTVPTTIHTANYTRHTPWILAFLLLTVLNKKTNQALILIWSVWGGGRKGNPTSLCFSFSVTKYQSTYATSERATVSDYHSIGL